VYFSGKYPEKPKKRYLSANLPRNLSVTEGCHQRDKKILQKTPEAIGGPAAAKWG